MSHAWRLDNETRQSLKRALAYEDARIEALGFSSWCGKISALEIKCLGHDLAMTSNSVGMGNAKAHDALIQAGICLQDFIEGTRK